jgi:hypothetical protein
MGKDPMGGAMCFDRVRAKAQKISSYFSELGELCVFAGVIVYPIPESQIQGKISSIFGLKFLENHSQFTLEVIRGLRQ